jgi:DNA helicase II / ATP-dependent DNA helicase PcrA
MEEGIFPHSRSFTNEKELEEERRLCYVGITRAKERLWLTFSEARVMMGGYSSQIPSRFLAEIPQELCDYYSWNA